MKNPILIFIIFLLGSLISNIELNAQVCFRGKSIPECKSYFVTEVSYVYALNHHSREFGWEFGHLFNYNMHHALGVTLLVNLDSEEDMGIGIKPRYRYWLNRFFSLDIAPGLILTRSNSNTPNFTGNIGINYKDWIALIAQADQVDKISGTRHMNYSFGVKIGSYPGAGIIAVSVVALTILYIGLSSSMGD